jgi:hypothetical protein
MRVEGIVWQSLGGIGKVYVEVWDEVEVLIRALTGVATTFIRLSHCCVCSNTLSDLLLLIILCMSPN